MNRAPIIAANAVSEIARIVGKAEIAARIAGGSTDIVARTLPKVQARVSAIYGENDALYGPRLPEVQAAMEQLAPRWGQWHTVPGVGHWVPYEATERFNAALIQVLRA